MIDNHEFHTPHKAATQSRMRHLPGIPRSTACLLMLV